VKEKLEERRKGGRERGREEEREGGKERVIEPRNPLSPAVISAYSPLDCPSWTGNKRPDGGRSWRVTTW
jgi:hypothetical protein